MRNILMDFKIGNYNRNVFDTERVLRRIIREGILIYSSV